MARQDFAQFEDRMAFGADPWAPVDELEDEWVIVSGDEQGAHVRAADAGDMSFGRSTRHGELESHGSTVKLGNDDGRYTPGNNASPYFPLTDGTPFQRVVTYPIGSGESLPLWGGVVTNWSADAEGIGSSVARADLQSRVSLLGEIKLENATRSIYSWATEYWPLDDEEGSDGAVNLGTGSKVPANIVGTKGAVDFGLVEAPGGYGTGTAFTNEGPGSERLTAVLRSEKPETVNGWAAGAWIWPLEESSSGMWLTINFAWLHTPAPVPPMVGPGPVWADQSLQFRFSDGELMFGDLALSGESVSVPLDIEYPRHVMLTVTDGDTARVYVDGKLVLTETVGLMVSWTWDGGWLNQVEIGGNKDEVLDGQISQVFVSSTIPTPEQLQQIVDTGWSAPSTADKHWERLCTNLGIPALTQGTFKTQILPFPIRDRTVAEVVNDIEKFERGRIVVDGQDQLVLLSCEAAHKYEPDPLILEPSKHFHVESGASLDATNAETDLSVIRANGGVEIRLVNEKSSRIRGKRSPSTETIYVTDSIDQLSWATWRMNERSEPRVRIPTIIMKAERLHQQGILKDVLARREGAVVQLGTETDPLPVSVGRWTITAVIEHINHATNEDGDWIIAWTATEYVAPFVIEEPVGVCVGTPGAFTLTSSIDAEETEIGIAIADGAPLITRDEDSWPITAEMRGERMLITQVVGDTSPQTLTIERGRDGTLPVAHDIGIELTIIGGQLL
ncbi:MAG: hypothetical protein WAS05_00260 [Candidatus Nanopelagicales bacterium]